jgi:CHASE3 domain sensor protein
MRWRRRRATASTEIVLAPRVERALVAIASHTEQLDGRLLELERRIEETTLDLPTQSDLLEVRMHSAKVAAELARVTVELRAEIEDRVAAAAVKESRLRTLAESIADLSDAMDTQPQDWAASA